MQQARLSHAILLTIMCPLVIINGMELANDHSNSIFFSDYTNAHAHYISSRPDLKLLRYDDISKPVWCPVSYYWLPILNQFNQKTAVKDMTEFLWHLPPENFWILYSDYDYFGECIGDRKYAFEHVIRCKYVKGTKVNCALYDAAQDDITNDNALQDDFLLSDPYSDYNVRISIRQFQDFLVSNAKTLAEVITQPDEQGVLDLSNMNISTISATDYPHADEIKTLLLSENWMQIPSLGVLRKLFPNLNTISFIRCPLVIPEQEGRTAWLSDLYAMHENQKGAAVKVTFPFYGKVTIGYLPVYLPLTIHLSSDCSPEVRAAFSSVAATKYYTIRRIIFRMSKMFFYITSFLGISLALILAIWSDRKDNRYRSSRDDDKVDEAAIEALSWSILGIVEEYQSEWVYKTSPKIIIE